MAELHQNKLEDPDCLFFVSLELTHLLLHGSEYSSQASSKAEMENKAGVWSFQSYFPYKRSKQRGLHAGNINLLGDWVSLFSGFLAGQISNPVLSWLSDTVWFGLLGLV